MAHYSEARKIRGNAEGTDAEGRQEGVGFIFTVSQPG